MSEKTKLLFLLSLVILVNCKKITNDKLDAQLAKEFYDSIKSVNAQSFEYRYDGLAPQESYFVNGKIRFLKFRTSGEDGFAERKIIFNNQTDSIEKYILREVIPNWETYNGNVYGDMHDEYFDTIYIIYPNKKQIFTYSKNKLVDSTFKPNIGGTNYIYTMKKQTEKKYNDR
ncbi:MAG: hypothetical protein LBE36_13090 [Flavobacteriaceae bacterium]|jgi:hypothetical protein|nr:hypothetical protein [Flavobacteriaceae bacterium]